MRDESLDDTPPLSWTVGRSFTETTLGSSPTVRILRSLHLPARRRRRSLRLGLGVNIRERVMELKLNEEDCFGE
jgi:hypothetical protein